MLQALALSSGDRSADQSHFGLPPAIGGAAALPPYRHRDIEERSQRRTHGITARAAATTDRLSDQPGRLDARRADEGIIGLNSDSAPAASGTATAPHVHRHLNARSRGIATVAAAAPDRLEHGAMRVVAGSMDLGAAVEIARYRAACGRRAAASAADVYRDARRAAAISSIAADRLG
ncbi:hypothetical protein BOTU111922_26500 [Bordetella tumulicola]